MKETNDDPSSMAIFEKKLRAIANTIKDNFIKKYIFGIFLEQISSLTPYSNFSKSKNSYKKSKSLKSTQKYFNDSKSLSPIEIKEFFFVIYSVE